MKTISITISEKAVESIRRRIKEGETESDVIERLLVSKPKKAEYTEEEIEIYEFCVAHFATVDPGVVQRAKSQKASWMKSIRKLLDSVPESNIATQKFTPEMIKRSVSFATLHSFWKRQIRSICKLEKRDKNGNSIRYIDLMLQLADENRWNSYDINPKPYHANSSQSPTPVKDLIRKTRKELL